MTNSHNNKAYSANTALQCFFDELTIPQNQSESIKSDKACDQMDEQIIAKISQAERLLSKANIINDLILGSNTKTLEGNLASHHSATKLSIYEQEKLGTAEIERKVNEECCDLIEIEQLRNLQKSLKDSLSNKFQVLLCEISSMKIAIPLVELGGIHQIPAISQVAKQAKWCAGVLINDSGNYTCIDASAWLKPYKADNNSVDDYKFGLQLGKTSFLLCCNSIKDTVELCKDDVKWRDNLSTQPWLAGLVKKEMCALIDGAYMVQDVLK